MGAIEDLQNMMNRDALQYPFDRLQTTAILDIAARLDKLTERVDGIEKALTEHKGRLPNLAHKVGCHDLDKFYRDEDLADMRDCGDK